MIRHFTVFVFCLALVSPIAGAGETNRGKLTGGVIHTAPDWFKESFLEIAEDVEEASEKGKHVLLFFQLNGCPYCDRMLSESFEADPLKSYIQEHFDVIAINVRGDREIAFNEELSVTEKALSQHLNVWATPGMIFLGKGNKRVLRVDGYRAPERFAHILSYVAERAYTTQKLSAYLEQQFEKEVYELRPNPMFSGLSDLSRVKGPLAVIFEDSHCHDCDEFHERTLADPGVIEALKTFTIVRLNAASNEPIVDVDGNKTTPRRWATDLQMNYRPGILLFADGEVKRRYDSLVYRHHFTQGVSWIGSGSYRSEDYASYSDRREEEILQSGQDIDLSR